MKKALLVMVFTAVSIFYLSASAWAVQGEAMGNPFLPGEKITRFVASYCKISEADLVKIADKCEYPDDTLAILVVAKLSGKKPQEISSMRLKGLSWDELLKKSNIAPSKLFFTVKSSKIPTLFANAYKQFDKWNKDKKYRIKLTDREVRYLSGVRFVAEAFGKDPFETMESFDNRITFVKIVSDCVEAGK